MFALIYVNRLLSQLFVPDLRPNIPEVKDLTMSILISILQIIFPIDICGGMANPPHCLSSMMQKSPKEIQVLFNSCLLLKYQSMPHV